MHNLDNLENKIRDTHIGKLLFNKYYNIRNLSWTLFYAISISLLAGIGNSISELNSGINNVFFLSLQGFVNNLYLSFFVNIFYPRIVEWLSHRSHMRRNGNILWAIIFALFVVWHFIIGTENPIQTNIIPNLAALIITNYHINILNREKHKI